MSETSKFVKLCHISELKEKIGKRFVVEEKDLAVFKLNGEIYAVGNICPHQKTASIYEGEIEDDCVVCPYHAWKFNLENGKKPDGNNGLKTYNIKIERDFVFVEISLQKLNW